MLDKGERHLPLGKHWSFTHDYPSMENNPRESNFVTLCCFVLCVCRQHRKSKDWIKPVTK